MCLTKAVEQRQESHARIAFMLASHNEDSVRFAVKVREASIMLLLLLLMMMMLLMMTIMIYDDDQLIKLPNCIVVVLIVSCVKNITCIDGASVSITETKTMFPRCAVYISPRISSSGKRRGCFTISPACPFSA